ncbi:unnamed protein product [Linum tenue]|uniref:F-box domain-containing protein n=1 Tax=Linum tenue TaxID=586396 RepID=A0AAV0NIB6_9ROSI|nr:unnamed protein product [Linum tenue]
MNRRRKEARESSSGGGGGGEARVCGRGVALYLGMQGRAMKPVCKPSADRITNLPADVTLRILELLPVKEAAKMAALSTTWRSHWRSVRRLVFDNDFAGAKSNKMMDRLMLNIYRVLLLHDGPIRKFYFLFSGLRSCYEYEIDQIIVHLSNRGLQAFALALSPADSHVYKLHSALFSCLQLDELSLVCCEFRQPSWFVGFGKLKNLCVMRVALPADFFENFLTKCPMLQVLLVVHCVGPGNLQLVAPRLRKFTFRGNLKKISFKHTPFLNSVSIALNGHREEVEKPVDTVALFASLPSLQTFAVDFQLLQLDSSHQTHPANNEAVTNIRRSLEAEERRGVWFCLRHLREFTIQDCLATQSELDLLRFVLATVPSLERVSIKSLDRLAYNTRIEFMKKVMTYKRASANATVVCD